MVNNKYVLIQKEMKYRENRRTTKYLWQKLGCHIRGHAQPHTIQKSKLTSVVVPVTDPGSWSRVDTKEQVEELLIKHNVEKFLHAGDIPFGYSALVDELGHTWG
jgi:hypothetical protein